MQLLACFHYCSSISDVQRQPMHSAVTHSPYLPPQVPEADVELVLLAGLSLVAAAVLCRGAKGVSKAGPPQRPQQCPNWE